MSFPVGVTRTASDLVAQVALAEPSVLPASCSKTTKFPVLVNSLAQPVYPRVPADDLVLRIDHNHLVELVDRVLANPI